MASTYRYATKELSINNAKAFVQAMNASDGASTKNSTILYAVIGRTEDWTDEPNPSAPPDNDQHLRFQVHREAYGAKKVTVNDICHVTDRYDWVSGTVYSMYRDTDTDMYARNWYVMTDDYNVYACLFNNKNATSTIKPTGFSTLPFTTSDGYIWKYMFTISLGDANKFLTSSYMPVRNRVAGETSIEATRQLAVQNAAVNGAIEVIEVNTGGSNYLYVANGAVTEAGRFTIRLSTAATTNASPTTGNYTRSSVYVLSGTGAGQLRRIVGYDGATRTLTVNSAFTTTCNTDSRVVVSPTVTVIGDGTGAKAYATVNTDIGSVSNIIVINGGSDYTTAHTVITANTTQGSGATANVIISPTGGHGSDMIRQLAADKIMINVQLDNNMGVSGTGAGYTPSNTEFRTISIMKDPVLKVNSNNEFVSTEYVANTSNSPTHLRLSTKLTVQYQQMDGTTPINALEVNDVITSSRFKTLAEAGALGFVTDLGADLATNSLVNAVRAANATVVFTREDETESDASIYSVYINNVDAYSNYNAFEVNDVVLRSTSATQIADVLEVQGPEANTYSGEILYTENVQAVTRDPDQIEDLKIILDF